jgi:hypothetical protein
MDANCLVLLPADQLDGDPGLWEFLTQEQVRLVTLAREHQLADRRARVQVRHFSTQSFHGTWNSIPLLSLIEVRINSAHQKWKKKKIRILMAVM